MLLDERIEAPAAHYSIVHKQAGELLGYRGSA